MAPEIETLFDPLSQSVPRKEYRQSLLPMCYEQSC
jgi:hypothetical protein